MEKSFRELHGEFLLEKIEADESLQGLTDLLIERITSPLPEGKTKQETIANLNRFIAVIYKSGYTNGQMDALARIVKDKEY